VIGVAFLLGALLCGCSGSAGEQTLLQAVRGVLDRLAGMNRPCGQGAAQLVFEAPMAVSAEGEAHVSLGVRNVGEVVFPGDEAFNGVMELRRADGTLRARAEVRELGRIEPEGVAWPAAWRGQLEPGNYRLTWRAASYGGVAVEFAVVAEGSQMRLREVRSETLHEGGSIEMKTAGDERGAELVALAKADLAGRLGVDVEEIEVRSIEPAQFPDASLGVPEPGKMYAQVITPGYIIRLAVGKHVYEYHGAGKRVVAVPD